MLLNKTTRMKVLGNRIMVEKPQAPESLIELTEEVKAQMDAELMKRWGSLTVTHVGTEATKVKIGDKVYIGVHALQAADVIQHNENYYFLVSENSVLIVHDN